MNDSKHPIRNICVYCGSRPGQNPAYADAARILGAAIADAGLGLVYGGGTRGLMGMVADAVMAGGGHVTGIIPEFLMEKEATREDLTALSELIVTRDMHERKHKMFERSDAFVALPGGIGTLEEIIEIMTWAQLGQHAKPIVFANIGGFWDPLDRLIAHMTTEGFIHTSHLVRPLIVDAPDGIVPAILAAAPKDGDGDSSVIEKL